jgi:hypothetical protein
VRIVIILDVRGGNYKEILFRFYSNVLEGFMVKTQWAEAVDVKKGIYRIDNIPFYIPFIAYDHLIHATCGEQDRHLFLSKLKKNQTIPLHG